MCIPCEFDFCEFINVFVGGLVVAAVFAIIGRWFQRRTQRKRYGRIEGEFNGRPALNNGNPISLASITFIENNILEIQLQDLTNGNNWIGFILCYSEKYGKVEGQYINTSTVQSIKQIVIDDSDNFKLIDSEKGYEYFKRAIKNETFIKMIKRRIRFYFDL